MPNRFTKRLIAKLEQSCGLRIVRSKRGEEPREKRLKEQRDLLKQAIKELRSSYYLSGANKNLDVRKIDGFGDIARQTISDRMTTMNYDRLYTLWQAVQNSPVDLPIVEIGVYRGGSAKFIAETLRRASRSPSFYVCDTFTGHSRLDAVIDTAHRDPLKFGNTSLQSVADYLAGYANIEFVVGDIVETRRQLPEGPYGFVHIDVDVLPPTDACLRFFGPRLSPGGAIVVDDYGSMTCPGAKKAVDDFVAEKPNFRMFHLLTGQALLLPT